MRRRLILLLGSALLFARSGLAQQAKKPRIGCLAVRGRSTTATPDVFYDGLVHGLRELGYVDGRNIVLECRFADGDQERLPKLAEELVRANVDLIVTHSTPATAAVKAVTTSIPVVTTVNDPVASGFAASLARPGSNITGLSIVGPELSAKHLEFLRMVVPSLGRIGVLLNPANASHPSIVADLEKVAARDRVSIVVVRARAPDEIGPAIQAAKQQGAQALLGLTDAFYTSQRRAISAAAIRHELPSIYPQREYVQAGVLLSYGQNLFDFYRRSALYVDKLLKGVRPHELPFEQPTTLHLAINRGTAKKLGLTLPRELLLRADELAD